MEDCLPWEGPHTGAREECQESSLRRPAETVCNELTATLIPCPPVPLGKTR